MLVAVSLMLFVVTMTSAAIQRTALPRFSRQTRFGSTEQSLPRLSCQDRPEDFPFRFRHFSLRTKAPHQQVAPIPTFHQVFELIVRTIGPISWG